MNNCALICEYNPFHTGHKYQLDVIRSTGADNIICIMSGSLVQSALPAFCEKSLRAKCAVLGGCDAVVELPALYATASAGYFARGGVKIASSIKSVTHLAMGATVDADDVLRIADVKIKYGAEINGKIKQLLNDGKSYNMATIIALSEIFARIYPDKPNNNVIEEPNNMLCVEYICALNEAAANIEPLIIKRLGAPHRSEKLDELHISATAIRDGFDDNPQVKKFVPYLSDEIAETRVSHAPDISVYNGLLLYAIKSESAEDISKLRNCADGMEYMFDGRNFGSIESYFDCNAFRRFGKKRVRRLFLDAALGAEKQLFDCDFCTRLLACKKDFDLSLLPRNIAADNGRLKALSSDSDVKRVLKIDERATSIYNTVCGIDGGYYNYSLVKV